jgi:hypothetical protein
VAETCRSYLLIKNVNTVLAVDGYYYSYLIRLHAVMLKDGDNFAVTVELGYNVMKGYEYFLSF